MFRLIFPVLLGVLACWTVRAAAPPVDFSRDILPLLADNCFHCHGPDEKGRKAKLRLDTLAGAQSPREGGKSAVVVPGRSRESELVQRILSADPDEVMPPPESHRTLSDEQKKLLQRWVDEGAKWGRHWAFEPIKAVSPPKPRTKWGANEIDRFILAKLEENALQPAAETSPGRLLRRLSLDLTGLPPTLAELDEFERAWGRATSLNQRQSVLAGVVDRLLSSPRYGERMAAEWLDVARYADTHGYQMDRPRPVWPYRDWVIKAFNENLPFDQFVTWQIAGDLLPNATQEQRLATAFNRLHMQNEEGGIVEEEFRVAYVVDRVNTFGTAFLGLTLECSRCHDHKYDPVSQRDFYSLFAFFQNIDEAGQTTYFTDATPVPAMPLTTPEQDSRLARLNQAVADAERNARLAMPQLEPAFQEWLKSRSGAPSAAGLAGAWSFDELKDNKAANSVNKDQPANAVEGPKLVAGKSGQAVELTGENGLTFPGAGQFTRTEPFTFAITLRLADHATRATVFHKSRAPADAGSRGYELVLEQGRAAFGLHHMWPGNSLKVRTRVALSTNDWSQLIITYDGSSRAAGVRIYVNGELAELETVRDGLTRDITYERDGQPDLALGFRFRDTGFKGGLVDDFRVFNRELTPLEIAQVAGRDDFTAAWSAPAEQLNPGQRAGLLAYYASQVSPLARRYAEAMSLARREQNSFVNSLPELMVMQEMPRPKPAFVLKRGAYDAPGEAVSMATPAALPALPAGAPTNRLGLARWLTAPENPLFARVTVNRAWQQMFGRGFVETSDNFGTQGSFPTHPDLIDWLARDFMAGGWNYRALLKKIALSATYRQDSRASDAARQRDPDNRLLSHAPPRRLSAEMLRDQALTASGLLVEKLGGPSVKPYQPDGFWDDAMGRPRYDQGHGDDLHRRSLYTYWKRTAPHPAMITFDAANRETCLVKRQSTATPLQSLALLNDTQVIESARFLAQRMLREGGPTLDRQVGWLFRLVTARQPSAQEVTVLRRLFEEQREVLAKDPLAVNQLLAVGEAVPDPSLPFSDLAAGTVLAKAILNHDEAVMRR